MRLSTEDIPRLVTAYYTDAPRGKVTFGTSGHRGSSLNGTFNESHIAAICQAVSELRPAEGPLYLGKDTHALSEPACATALEVFGANGVSVILAKGYTPTPVLSHAVLTYNRGRSMGLADAVIITPSHNPPVDGGFKYNPPSGGPAPSELTRAIELRARDLMRNTQHIKRMPLKQALSANETVIQDLMPSYVDDLSSVVDMEAIAGAKLKIGVDPMGGAAVHYWEYIADRYNVGIETVNKTVNPAFDFMPLDHDGKVRMDCSSQHAMANLVKFGGRFDIAFGNDPDVDRHGIVTPSGGLMNPNHYLAVAGGYLFENRDQWPEHAAWAKTLVSSSMLNFVAEDLGRTLSEVPVGFKWFVNDLMCSDVGFAGEESAGATFLRRDGTVWTTDKDGIIMGLLAAEILARTDRDPGEHYRALEERFAPCFYQRIDAPAHVKQKEALASLSPADVGATTVGGDPILHKLTRAPGNNAPIGGLKVVTRNSWFAVRPSGTEDLYKIYAESFVSEDHLRRVLEEAQFIMEQTLGF